MWSCGPANAQPSRAANIVDALSQHGLCAVEGAESLRKAAALVTIRLLVEPLAKSEPSSI